MTIDALPQHHDTALKGFETLLSTAGSIYPVVLPYVALGAELVEALSKLWDATDQRETWRISERIRLEPPQTPRAKTLREGQYVIFNQPIDGTQYQLADNGQVAGELSDELTYAVFRIDASKIPSMDYVVSQKVATLLTQLKNDRDDQPAGMLETSFGYLTETLKAYTNFTDLQRYQELQAKPKRTEAEESQLQRIASRPELKPFLPNEAGNATATTASRAEPEH